MEPGGPTIGRQFMAAIGDHPLGTLDNVTAAEGDKNTSGAADVGFQGLWIHP